MDEVFNQWKEPGFTVSPAEALRCYVLHWWRHRWVRDDGIAIKHCPKCDFVMRVRMDSATSHEREQS